MTTISDLTTWTYVEVINTRWGGKVPLATRLVCGRPGPRPTQCGSEQGVFQAKCGSEQGVGDFQGQCDSHGRLVGLCDQASEPEKVSRR